MANDNNDYSGSGKREPRFGGFDDRDLDEYEEPDRDSGFTSRYDVDDEVEEEDFDDLFASEDDDEPQAAADANTAADDEYADLEDNPDEALDVENGDDEYEDEDEEDTVDSGWPLRLVAVAAVAVALLAAGVYGVLKERAATQAELLELRASLATSANQDEVRATRDALRELQQSHEALVAEAAALAQENRELRDTIAGLEAHAPTAATANREPRAADTSPKPRATAAEEKPATLADALSTAAAINKSRQAPPGAQTVATAAAPTVSSATTPAAATAGQGHTAAAPSVGGWFVNFGSYSYRALAESWAARLHPAKGEVIVVPGTKDGNTYYRVRIVALGSKGDADMVARQLEAELQVSRLWVGHE